MNSETYDRGDNEPEWLKKSVNATLIYTKETQNTLTDLVNIFKDLIKHLKVLKEQPMW
jgi:hypothetical protein